MSGDAEKFDKGLSSLLRVVSERNALAARVATLENALREILVVAAPAWSQCPSKGGWHEPYGDIASLAEVVLGESVIEARAALSEGVSVDQ